MYFCIFFDLNGLSRLQQQLCRGNVAMSSLRGHDLIQGVDNLRCGKRSFTRCTSVLYCFSSSSSVRKKVDKIAGYVLVPK